MSDLLMTLTLAAKWDSTSSWFAQFLHHMHSIPFRKFAKAILRNLR